MKIGVGTGFHRSGTSLLAEYLGECGLFLGKNVKAASELECGSLTGHSDDQGISGLHQKALATRGIAMLTEDLAFAGMIPVAVSRVES